LWNVESLSNVYRRFGKYNFPNFDLLILTETFLLKSFSIRGFYSKHILGFKNNILGRPMRGVSIFYNAKFGELVSYKCLRNFLILNFSTVSIVGSYLNPNLNCEKLWDQLLNAFQYIDHKENLIFAGDFNCRLDMKAKKGELIMDFAAFNNLKLANTVPLQSTYVSPRGTSVVDLIFCGPNIKHQNFLINDSYLRKHRLLSLDFQISSASAANISKTPNNPPVNPFLFEVLVAEKYRSLLRDDIQRNNIETFYSHILALIKESKITIPKSPRKSQPWFDSECYAFKRDLHFLRAVIDSFPYVSDFNDEKLEILNIFSATKKEYRKLCKVKTDLFQEKIDCKILYEAEKTCYKLLKLNSKDAYVENDISIRTWEDSFSEIFNANMFSRGDSLNLKSLLKDYPKEQNIKNILEDEVILAVKSLKSKKAPGLDLLRNENIKDLCLFLVPEITAFFNLCLKNGAFPESWKLGNLKLLYKGKGSPADVNSYRGICLSSALYNLLDRVLNTRLYSSEIEAIPANQYGFVRGKSTIHAIKILIDEINTSVYVKKKPLYALFLDVKKAFDSIDRTFIFKKLVESKKLSFEELNLIAEMLDINYLILNDGVTVSEVIIQSNGVRQGGCLSPFLFIYALSDFNNAILDCKNIRALLYADDIVLTSDNLNDIKAALLKIDEFLSLCNLKLNLSKCKIMKFRTKGKGRYKKDDILKYNGQIIDFVSEFCYLGVVFQASGTSFTKHIDKRVKAAIFAMSKLNSLPQTSVQTALKLFDLAISPVASYGLEAIWPFLTTADLFKLETVKSRFLKRVLSLSKYTKSRFVYELIETDLFVNDLKSKFSLSDTSDYDKFMEQKLITFSEIDPDFYLTPAMCNTSWKEINCKDRHMFTRYACHGFHHLFCKDKMYHFSAKENCECEKCGESIKFYHLFECKANSLTLSQAASL
jgi:hypothetical protein